MIILSLIKKSAYDGHDVTFGHDDQVFAVVFDFSSSITGEQNEVSLFYAQTGSLSAVEDFALTYRNNFALLRLLFGRFGQINAAGSSIGSD
jgi:hypothetical protein